jgi:hypothetical protein
MYRLEIEVRKTTKLFISLSIISLATFPLPFLIGPEYWYFGGFGLVVATLAIATYAFSPTENKLIAEIDQSTLRILSLRNPWVGVGSLYLPHPQEIDLAKVTKIVTMLYQPPDSTGAYCLGIHSGSDIMDVFMETEYFDEANVLLREIVRSFPSISIEPG